MELKKIKLHGFKSFEKQTELEIESGLTGIVGPNGCGKSNVLDSLQWVMGETSYKNLRGSEMDDVIFSGTDSSPSRNFAEVSVVMSDTNNTSDNKQSDENEYEIKRRIERNSGSKYYINSIEKRAKDVQLFFADNSLGPHSISIVKQGQINQIIEAKPNERRKILEEAAGISGLHHRKHEAILRLNATKLNIERLGDIISVIGTEMSSLKRQANQAEKFKIIASQIRDYEKELIRIDWHSITTKEKEFKENIYATQERIGVIKNKISDIETENNDLLAGIKPIKKDYDVLIDDLQHKRSDELNLKNELQYTTEKISTVSKQIDQVFKDKDREQKNVSDQIIQLKNIEERLAELHKNIVDIQKIESNIIEASTDATDSYKILEKEYNSYLSEVITMETESANIQDQIEGSQKKLEELIIDLENVNREKSHYNNDKSGQKDRESSLNKQNQIEKELISLLSDIDQCEKIKVKLSQDFEKNKELKLITDLELRQLGKSKNDLEDYLRSTENPEAVINKIKIIDDFEDKIGKILCDLETSSLQNGKKFWISANGNFDDKFAVGITPLNTIISGPKEIALFLRYTGYTQINEKNEIIQLLKPGQQVINSNGEIIRWDGFIQKFETDSESINVPQAKKKVGALDTEIRSSQIKLEKLIEESKQISGNLEKIATEEATKKESWKSLIAEQKMLSQKIKELDQKMITEKDANLSIEIKISSIEEYIKINKESIESSSLRKISKDEIEKARNILEKKKQDFYNAKTIADIKEANTQSILREKRDLEKTQKDLLENKISWETRKAQTENHLKDLDLRLNNSKELLVGLELEPDRIRKKQSEVGNQLEDANQTKLKLQHKLDSYEQQSQKNNEKIKLLESELMKDSEILIQARADLKNLEEKRSELNDKIKINLGLDPQDLAVGLNQDLMNREKVIELLSQANSQREKIGAVNLTAADQFDEKKVYHEKLCRENDDLISATETLQKGIIEIDKEARERLHESYNKVNTNFKLLFEKLFDGGKAELRLDDNEDILEAGLDIIAWPPGKKPQTISLLSGGEQALTVIALILAVFLENPSPICILDEVDAPLDDTNVKKFCDTLDDLSGNSNTKFLIVTHHPYTMSRMDRLFGITMAKKGESVILSVDLNQAEKIANEEIVA